MRKTRKHQNRLYLNFWRAVYYNHIVYLSKRNLIPTLIILSKKQPVVALNKVSQFQNNPHTFRNARRQTERQINKQTESHEHFSTMLGNGKYAFKKKV